MHWQGRCRAADAPRRVWSPPLILLHRGEGFVCVHHDSRISAPASGRTDAAYVSSRSPGRMVWWCGRDLRWFGACRAIEGSLLHNADIPVP
jgi:hypothetical protein